MAELVYYNRCRCMHAICNMQYAPIKSSCWSCLYGRDSLCKIHYTWHLVDALHHCPRVSLAIDISLSHIRISTGSGTTAAPTQLAIYTLNRCTMLSTGKYRSSMPISGVGFIRAIVCALHASLDLCVQRACNECNGNRPAALTLVSQAMHIYENPCHVINLLQAHELGSHQPCYGCFPHHYYLTACRCIFFAFSPIS